MALVIGEGIAGKARKLKGRVEKMKMEGWDWLDKLIAGAAKSGDGEKTVGIKPLDKYLRDLIGGRPVFAYPMRKGGFRLRYGRSRNTGFAAAGMHPATLYVLGEFLATGTQMKTERPGKACGVVPVDSIEGPTVRLKNGDVLRIDDEATAKRLKSEDREDPRCRRDPHLVRGVPREQPPARPRGVLCRMVAARQWAGRKAPEGRGGGARDGPGRGISPPGLYVVLGRHHG